MEVQVHIRMPLETVMELDRRALLLRAKTGKVTSRNVLINTMIDSALKNDEGQKSE